MLYLLVHIVCESTVRFRPNTSLEKGLSVLRAFDGSRRTLRLKDIVEITGLEKSAAQRFTYTLLDLGLLRRDETTKEYSLSPRVLELASAFLKCDPLVERAYPYLLEASRRMDEAVNLVLLEGDAVIFAARIPGRQPFALDIVIGDWYPAWAIADGRAILASLPEQEARAIITHAERRAYTPQTITEVDSLMAELRAARKLGYAYAADQYVLETMSIGAPVLGFAGRPEAAVTIHGPTSRITEKVARRELAPIVMETARAISTVLLGRRGLPPLPRPQRP
jgi:IclR family transcriptional regulator, pca regulon regulatory protein